MGLETVKEEILGSSKQQASSILSEAKKEALRIKSDADKKIDELKEKSEQDAKRIVEGMKRQEIASSDLESKKILLETKKQLIDEVFDETKKTLENLDDKKREVFLKKLLDKVSKDIEVGHVYCNKKDSKLIKTKAEVMEILGGIMAENKDKTIRVDYSYDTMLQTIKETQMQHINKILFGNN